MLAIGSHAISINGYLLGKKRTYPKMMRLTLVTF